MTPDLPILARIAASQEADRIRYAKMAASQMSGSRKWAKKAQDLRTAELKMELGRG